MQPNTRFNTLPSYTKAPVDLTKMEKL